jgi:hypothetical protein
MNGEFGGGCDQPKWWFSANLSGNGYLVNTKYESPDSQSGPRSRNYWTAFANGLSITPVGALSSSFIFVE